MVIIHKAAIHVKSKQDQHNVKINPFFVTTNYFSNFVPMNEEKIIKFPVYVGGKPMLATIVSEESNPVQPIYRIRFSNGYEDVFCLDEGTIEGDNKETSIPYAKAIRNDIINVINLDTKKFWHIFQHPIDGIATNVWVIEKDNAYQVFYNEYYRFELKLEENEWIVSSRSKDPHHKIDPVIAEKAESILRDALMA